MRRIARVTGLGRMLPLFGLLLICNCTGGGSLMTGSGSRLIEGTRVSYYSARNQVFFVLWHDMHPATDRSGARSTATSESSPKLIEIEGEYASDDGKRLTWSCRSTDGVTGTVEIDGRGYDLTQGGLFVVRDNPGGVAVTQVRADLGDVGAIDGTLERLEQQEPAVRAILESGGGD